ncbi:MAG TPA: hypothetical protein PK011_04400, partial [Marinagarivorans sp.]|nr:hypothetical protein [Marinagarivorans sp.]
MKLGLISFILFSTCAATTLPSFASSDSYDRSLLAHEPDPELTQMGAQIGTAYLHPWNDTRINLSLLLQDQRPQATPTQSTQMPAFDDSLAPKSVGFYIEEQNSSEAAHSAAVQTQLQRLKIPAEAIIQAQSRLNNWREGRCVSDSWSSLQQFLSQLELAGLKEEETHALGLARLALAGSCPTSKAAPIEIELSTPAAKEFALYIK